VVIPTFGRERVLVETLRRVLALDPPPAEVLVMDQSPTHEQDVARALAELDQAGSIRWIRLPRPSIPGAMNRGLELARHATVIYLDDDVVPVPGLVSGHLAAQQGAGIVVGQVLQPGEEPAPADGRAFAFNSSAPQEIGEIIGCNFSVRRRLALSVGGFDERFVAVAYRFEQEFADRARRAGESILFEPAASVRHLRAPRGGTRSYGTHLRTARPNHTVGGYYYLLRARPSGWLARVLRNPLRAICTRHHLRRPWWIVPTLLAETGGLIWALCLVAAGPKLIRPDEDAR
jgi:GT2 family glycosyltransferase